MERLGILTITDAVASGTDALPDPLRHGCGKMTTHPGQLRYFTHR